MKMKTLIRRAYEIIAEEQANVFAEFCEDDGSITAENRAKFQALDITFCTWMSDAERVLGERPRRKKKPAPRGVVQKPFRKIVVVGGKGSALE